MERLNKRYFEAYEKLLREEEELRLSLLADVMFSRQPRVYSQNAPQEQKPFTLALVLITCN